MLISLGPVPHFEKQSIQTSDQNTKYYQPKLKDEFFFFLDKLLKQTR